MPMRNFLKNNICYIYEWNKNSWITLGNENLSKDFNKSDKHRGDNDLSARVALQWDNGAFYLACDVTDDNFFRARDTHRSCFIMTRFKSTLIC